MHDFYCKNPDDMHYKELADKARYFKSEEGGLEIMGDVMEKFFAKREKEVKAKAEAKAEAKALKAIKANRINLAKEMLSNNEDVEKIVKYSKLSLTEVQKLAKKLSA